MSALSFLAFLALVVTGGIRIGCRQARATYVLANAQNNADVMWMIPAGMEMSHE